MASNWYVFAVAWVFSIPCVSAAQQVALKGIVTDGSKKPLPSAQIIAVPDEQRYWTPQQLEPLAESKSGPDGKFSMSVSTTGPVALIGWAREHRMTKFSVNPNAAQGKTIGLALPAGFTLDGQVLDAATGDAIASAEVGPLVAGIDTEMQRSLRVVPQWTTADATGAFKLEGLAADIDHTFLVRAPGYVIAHVELSQGQKKVDVKLGKGGFSVSGEVYARGKKPEAFANVIVRANGNGFDVVTRTDQQGRFRIDGLPGGNFSVEPLMPGSGRAAEVKTIELPQDDKTSISLEVSSGYAVRGTAIDSETSAPANQVSIGLNDHWTTSSTDGSFALGPFFQAQQLDVTVPEEDGWQLQEVVTDNEYNSSDGFTDVNNMTVRVRRQRLLAVTLGNFEQTTQPVLVSALSRTGGVARKSVTTSSLEIPVFTSGTYTLFATAGGMASQVESVSVNSERSVPIMLNMQVGADVSGRLTVVNSDESTRVQTLRLALYPSIAGQAGPPLIVGTSPRPDGGFNFPAMPTGTFILGVSNQSGTRQTTQVVTLTPGSNDLGEIVWEAGNRISGRITNPTDTPVPFAQVGMMLPDGQTLRVEADEEGKFRAEDLAAPELAKLLVEAGSFSVYREQNIALPADDKHIVMQPLGKLTITVESPAASQWTVHVVRMGRWGTGAYAEQLVGQTVFLSDAMGGEPLEVGLGEKGTFRAVAIGKSSEQVMVSPAFEWAGEATEGKAILLANAETGTISGSVADATAPVEVTVINTALPDQVGQQKGERTVAVSDGRYSVAGLLAGNYLVLGQGETYSAYALNVELLAGATASVDLTSVEMATLAGSVELAGEPLPEVSVRLLSETDPQFAEQTATTDAEGNFAFEGLLPDSYSVATNYNIEDTEVTARKSVTVSVGKSVPPIQLDLTPPQAVTFTIDAAAGIPPGTQINIMSRETRQLTPARWVNGTLQADVAPGEYEVWLGDAVAGLATVNEDGAGVITKAE